MRLFNIQVVSELTGLSTHCIRAWEKRYGAIKPARSDNGRRLYSEQELNRLAMLGKLSSLGNSISLIANLSDEELKSLLSRMTKGLSENRELIIPKGKNLVDAGTYLNNMFLALNSYKLDVLTHELNKASQDLSYREFALDVLGGLFRKVGEYVASGKMTIAQEHTLSALTKFFIGKRIAHHYASPNPGSLKIILATPSGEQHSIGLMLACLLMAQYSLDFIYLGEDLPVESIAEATHATNSDVVLLGISHAYSGRNRDINEVSLNLRRSLHPKKEIWLGGAVKDVKPSTMKEANLTLFDDLALLDRKLSQIVDPH